MSEEMKLSDERIDSIQAALHRAIKAQAARKDVLPNRSIEQVDQLCAQAKLANAPVPADEPVASRDWTEDFPHENGNYQCVCCKCASHFMGHKRRVICKACARPSAGIRSEVIEECAKVCEAWECPENNGIKFIAHATYVHKGNYACAKAIRALGESS